ncbi:MAG: hypothetical protein HOM11_03370 [Methylococcales bacterium]|jgi:hypothetical protein|nr:hypothetical protein [Methylococcales bacterium]MBT7442889.1 hypothetical protein [Methylococcales bacterium]
MPYYIYRIKQDRSVDYTDIEFEQYKEAKTKAREMRAELSSDNPDTIKVVFAKNNDEAVDLLLTPGTPRPKGEDY